MEAICLSLCACGNAPKEEAENQGLIFKGDSVLVNDEAVLSRLGTIIAARKTVKPEFSTTCKVKAIPSCIARIAPMVEGRIVKSYITLGEKISKGAPIFAISSADYSQIAVSYLSAKEAHALAEKNLSRIRDLVSHKVGAVKDLEQAQTEAQQRVQELKSAESALAALHVDPEDCAPEKPLIVRAPICGSIVQNELVIGQYLKSDSEPVVTVAATDRVYVVANVKEKDIHLLSGLDSVEIRLIAYPSKTFTGRIFNVGELLDERTQSVEVTVACENPLHEMKPAMYGDIRMIGKEEKVLSVPTSAVLQDESYCYVFEKIARGSFLRRPVSISGTFGEDSIISGGLSEGVEIVSECAFLLEAKN